MAVSFTQSCYGGPKNVSPAEAMTWMQAAKLKGRANWWRKLTFDYELQSIKGHPDQINVCVAKCCDCNNTFSVANLSDTASDHFTVVGEGKSATYKCKVKTKQEEKIVNVLAMVSPMRETPSRVILSNLAC
jgi:hypothetical protein